MAIDTFKLHSSHIIKQKIKWRENKDLNNDDDNDSDLDNNVGILKIVMEMIMMFVTDVSACVIVISIVNTVSQKKIY